jgi:hypothetical protein
MIQLFSFTDSTVLQELISNFASGIPNFVMALVLIIIGFIVSKLVSKLVKKFLEKLGVDKLGDKLNEIDIVAKSSIQIKISTILSKVSYYFLVLFFMVAATDVLDMPAVSNLVMGLFNLIPSIIVAGIILVLGTLFADTLRSISQTALDSLGVPSARLISSLLFYFLFINIVISALTQAKINTEFLSQNISLLIGGIVLAFAIGYGLASKTSMSNFLASFYSKGKFDVGDTITIAGETGKIVIIDKSSLTIVNEKGNKVIFPLNQINNQKIEIHN